MNKLFYTIAAFFAFVTVEAQTIQDGVKQIESMKLATAKQTFINLVQQQPTNGETYYYLSEVYLLTGEDEQAEKIIASGLSTIPDNAYCLLGNAKLKINKKDLEGAKADIVKAVGFTKNKNAKVLVLAGIVLSQGTVKDFDAAEKYINRAIEIDPKYTDAYIALGDVGFEKHDPQQPIANYEKALEVDNKCLVAYLRKAKLYADARTKEGYMIAQTTLKEGIALDPEFAPFYSEMAYLNNLVKDYKEAKSNYEKYLSIVGDDLYARVKYANFLFLSKEYNKTIEEVKQIISKDDSRPYLYRLMAYSHYEIGLTFNKPEDSANNKAEFVKGLEDMNTFFAKQTDLKKIITDDYRYYGSLLIKNGKDSLGLVNLLKAIEIAKENEKDKDKLPDLYTITAEQYMKNKKYVDAAKMYQNKIDIKGNANDYFQKGRAYYLAGTKDSVLYDSAVSAYTVVTQLKPDFALGHYNLARAKSNRDPNVKIGDAKPHYEKFLEMTAAESDKYKKEYVQAYLYLGFWHYYLGTKNDGIPFFKKVLEIDPKDTSALSAKKILKF